FQPPAVFVGQEINSRRLMRKFLIMLGVVAAMAIPALAVASSSTAQSAANKQCKAEQQAMGDTVFNNTYGTNKNKSNAFGKCVSQHAKAQEKQDGTQS